LENGTGQDRQAIDGVITKIFYPIQREDLALKIQAFWEEFDDFQSATGEIYNGLSDPFSSVLVETAPHRWHKIWTQPYTLVFGYIPCQVTSKPLGCGGAERTWGAFRHLKNGRRAHMSAEKLERQTTVYAVACIEKSRALQASEERHGMVLESWWTDADIAYGKGVLYDWTPCEEPDLVLPVVAPVVVPVALCPVHPVLAPIVEHVVRKPVFKAWIEDWEWDCFDKKEDPEPMRHLLLKYDGLHWLDVTDLRASSEM
jgi:hypothetical protein